MVLMHSMLIALINEISGHHFFQRHQRSSEQ